MLRSRWMLILAGIAAVVSISACTLLNRAPLASFTAAPISGVAPLTVHFDAGPSSDPDGDSLTYTWTFGDGAAGVGRTLSHVYAVDGEYTVQLIVTDRWGMDSTASQTILVADAAGDVVARIIATRTSGTAPMSVAFNATTSSCASGDIVAYQWAFGDGDVATGSATGHTYSTAGTYTVRLTVVTSEGATGTATMTITVSVASGGGC